MKKTIKVSGSESDFKAVASRKKRKEGALTEGVDDKGVATEVPSICSWGSETGNTNESESVDMEEEYLVEKTSFDYGEDSALAGEDYDQTPMSSKVKTKKALGKPLEKIDFSKSSDDNDVFLDASLELLPPMKNLVNVLVRKSFALDIGLDKVAGKSSQEKLVVVRKLFSRINGFGGASTSSKFLGIIRAMFTSKLSLMKATDKTISVKILVNTDLKKSSGWSDRAVVVKEILIGTSAKAVRTALSEFGVVKAIKMQLIGLWQKTVVDFEQSDQTDLVAVEALLYTLPMGTNAHNIWDFVKFVSGKTYIINCHPVTYAQARCAVVCFDSAESLDAAVRTMPVLKNTNLYWSHLISTKCAKYKKLGHMSLSCVVGGKFSSGSLLRRVFSDTDKSRLATIYAKCLAPVACLVFFGGLSWAKVAHGSSSLSLSNQNVLVNNGSSSEMKLPLLVMIEQIGKLAKRLDALGPMVLQPSPGCQPLVTPSSQNQGADVVMSEGSGASTSGGNVAGVVSFNMSSMSKLEDSMKCLMETVLGLLAKVDSIGVHSKDIIRWHKEMNNMVFIVIEMKLRSKVLFTSGLNSGHLGAGIAVVLDISLACHVYKVSEVPGWLLSIKLLFKGKLSVSILGLYAGVFLAVQFFQAGKINSLIVKAVNESSFTVLGGDFNEDDSCKCASFRKCLDLGLANSLVRSPAVKMPTWANSKGIRKTIDYVLVSSNLVNAIVHHGVSDVGEYFEMDYQAVSVSLGLGGLLDMQLNSLCKQVNRDHWKFNFKDLDVMWNVVHKIMVLLADKVFKKKWFKDYDGVFTKESSKFHKLKLLISKLVKASQLICCDEFISLLDVWGSLNDDNAFVVRSLFLSGSPLDTVQSALSKIRKTYRLLKMAELRHIEKSQIKSVIKKRMESFELNKGHTIQSVLECSFHKVVLDHLVVNDELILEPGPVRLKYQPLNYVFDEAFSGVIQPIEFLELFGVVSDLPIGKAAGFSGISNKLWMHSDRSVLDMLLVLLNSCLSHESVPALIETAHKILSKILSDRILLACSAHDILHENNFSVLKGTTIQTPIFAIGSVLVLQDMQKVYDSVGWEHLERCLVRIKMCDKFIYFFGNIHRNRTNRVMMDFSLTNGYSVHDGLDQGEVFSSLLWCIFYDPLLCEVKRQKNVCRYKLNSHFAATQHILNVASESYWYFGIFLSTNGLSKPSLVKVHSDIHFFSNLVLKKAVSDKQFLYLVLVVLHLIVSYRMQFSFVLVSVCDKWDALIHKGLKLKSGFPFDFPSDMIYHLSFYGLKFFSQCQSKSKVASLISFANSCGILSQLFSYRSHDLQVMCWHSIHLLSSLARIRVSIPNNFLSGMVHIFLKCNLSLGGSLASSFWFHDGVPISAVLGESLFFKYLSSLWCYGIAFWWKKLDPCGPVPEWFGHSVAFLSGVFSSPLALSGVGPTDICGSDGFVSVYDRLSRVGADSLSVYTNKSVKNLGTTGCRAGAAAFFEDIDLGLGICVQSLMSSTLAELQAVALALECIPVDCSVHLFLDSQAALDACKLECWIEHRHIRNIIRGKNLKVNWHKVKSHFGVLKNNCANSIADAAALSDWFLPPRVVEQFLLVDGGIVSSNSRHFVYDVFHAEVSSSSRFLASDLHSDVDWLVSSKVWHPDLHMATGFTSRCTADICTYFMKALHHWLSMAVRKRIYDKCYPSVLCLYCDEMEVSDHVFSCVIDDVACHRILESCMSSWKVLSGLFLSASCVLQLLLACASDFLVFSTLCKGFVFKGWLQEAVSVFHVPKVADIKIADFVRSICVAFRDNIWLVHAKHHAYIERNGLILVDGLVSVSISGLTSRFSDGVIKLLGIAEAFGIRFGFRKSCFFFSGIGDLVSINIIA
ncbi:hypothetical protein G9A89_014175 [Geosiphon pyriformis]|nr:hypothetical protein G9A89_014175 [Geosiphon pyriformis]